MLFAQLSLSAESLAHKPYVYFSFVTRPSWVQVADNMKILAVVLLFSFINFSLGCTGCVNLDDLTFSKVVKKFKSALVKFDMEYPFGDVHEVFATFASEVNNKTKSETDHPELLVAVVGMKDYGELDNKDLSAKYGLHKRTDGPIIKLFNDGDLENPISFDIGRLATCPSSYH